MLPPPRARRSAREARQLGLLESSSACADEAPSARRNPRQSAATIAVSPAPIDADHDLARLRDASWLVSAPSSNTAEHQEAGQPGPRGAARGRWPTERGSRASVRARQRREVGEQLAQQFSCMHTSSAPGQSTREASTRSSSNGARAFGMVMRSCFLQHVSRQRPLMSAIRAWTLGIPARATGADGERAFPRRTMRQRRRDLRFQRQPQPGADARALPPSALSRPRAARRNTTAARAEVGRAVQLHPLIRRTR